MSHLAPSSLTLSLTVSLTLLLMLGCQRGQSEGPSPDPAFEALGVKQRVLLKKVLKGYGQLYQAVSAKRLAEMQLYAGGVSEAAKSVQFSLDLESSGAVAMVNLSAQQITFTRSTLEASQQFEDLTKGLDALVKRFPSLGDQLTRHRCKTAKGEELLWLTPSSLKVTQGAGKSAQAQGAPYLHKSCP